MKRNRESLLLSFVLMGVLLLVSPAVRAAGQSQNGRGTIYQIVNEDQGHSLSLRSDLKPILEFITTRQ
jgi:hypothetical protein